MSEQRNRPDTTTETVLLKELDVFDATEVTPEQAAAMHQRGLLSARDIVALADAWLENGVSLGSAEIAAIALNRPQTLSEAGESLKAALHELGVVMLTGEIGVLVKLHIYLCAIINGRVEVMRGMAAINKLYYERGEARLTHPKADPNDPTDYLGRELGLQYLYTWYRELQDAEDGSSLFYYNELAPDAQTAKFREVLISEARVLQEHLARHLGEPAGKHE